MMNYRDHQFHKTERKKYENSENQEQGNLIWIEQEKTRYNNRNKGSERKQSQMMRFDQNLQEMFEVSQQKKEIANLPRRKR